MVGFQYAVIATLNCQNIKKDSEIIAKIETFIDQYNWKDIDFPSHKKDWIKSLSQIINQLLLISYMCHLIVKK